MTTQTSTAVESNVTPIGLHRIVAANIRAEVARQDATQARIAEILGISQQVVSNRLKGKTPFTLNEVGIIANELGVSLASLFETKNDPRPGGPDEGHAEGAVTGRYRPVRLVSSLTAA